MINYVRYTLTVLIISILLLSASACSYLKMTFHNEKERILKKIPPLAAPVTVDKKDISGLTPRITNYYKNLDDQIFDHVHGEEGLFFPERFLSHIRNNFYILDKDSGLKIPIIFVHGAGGTPADWKYLIKKIDHNKFFPVVYYYPTGIRLERSANLLYEGIKRIHEEYGQVILIAHSMGGLISRGAIRLLIQKNEINCVPLYISLSAPYGGHVNAQDGIEHLPESAIVQSWKDIASGSEYIKTLYTPSIAAGTDFHLFFGYKDPKKFRIGSNSDGSITIKSQLDFRAQKESKRLYGFDDDHETILKDDKVISSVNEILENTAHKIHPEHE